ncbi:MAG: DUF1844 domain-containing protein [Verrucomicrobiota bacterium]|jgi:hypothetical protein|nr:DUF1844 domain-containing protein [Verrucomicrobiota bacterium]
MSEKQNEALFQGLVISLASAAMQHMGKTVSPLSNKLEKNMAAAESTIDMLDMLEAKTKGNLGESESKWLIRVLADLKLNYVEILNETPPAPSAAAASEELAEASPAEKPVATD